MRSLLFRIIVSFVVVIALSAEQAIAASLTISPASATYSSGDTFSVQVLVGSDDQPLNAVSGNISFAKDLAEVQSINTGSSIIKLWVREPSFSNNDGRISFEGLVLNPGFQGSAGTLFTIHFKAKTEGTFPIKFVSGIVLANDGRGTSILDSFGEANYTIGQAQTSPGTEPDPTLPPEPLPDPNPTPQGSVPSAPVVSSQTHPESEIWYNNNNPQFIWNTPSGVTGVAIFADQESDTIPTRSFGVFNSQEYSETDDGEWYFHIRFKSSAGWGSTTHIPFKIDTENPLDLSIAKEDTRGLKQMFRLTADDSLSGIDHYEVTIDQSKNVTYTKNGDGYYEAPLLVPGSHDMEVKAVDRAGNFVIETYDFLMPALEAPSINVKENIDIGERLAVSGTTYENIKITIWVENERGERTSYQVQSDSSGSYLFKTQSLEKGSYEVLATIHLAQGAGEISSERKNVSVNGVLLDEGLTSSPIRFDLSSFGNLGKYLGYVGFLLASILLGWFVGAISRRRKGGGVSPAQVHSIFIKMQEQLEKHFNTFKYARSKEQFKRKESTLKRQIKKDMEKSEKKITRSIKKKKKKK